MVDSVWAKIVASGINWPFSRISSVQIRYRPQYRLGKDPSFEFWYAIHCPKPPLYCVSCHPPVGHGSLTLNLLLDHNHFNEDKCYFPPEVKTQIPYLRMFRKFTFGLTPFRASRSLGSGFIGLSGLLCKLFHISCSLTFRDIGPKFLCWGGLVAKYERWLIRQKVPNFSQWSCLLDQMLVKRRQYKYLNYNTSTITIQTIT